MKLPDILTQDRMRDAARLVNEYYTKLYRNELPQTGSRFDDWAGGGDREAVAHSITADDLLAVSFLSVEIPPPAAIGIIETRAGEVTSLLEQIPTNLDLASATTEDFEALLGSDSPANSLWRLLRGSDSYRWGIGPTTASKIMARKRPRLIPIFDSVVGPLMGHHSPKGQWKTWHTVLSNGAKLPEHLRAVKEASGIRRDISDLRTMDVVLWMHGKELGMNISEKSNFED